MLRVAFVIFVVLMVQQVLMVPLRISGAHPDLLWLLPITAALLDGPETGAVVGFWSGLAFDLVMLFAVLGAIMGQQQMVQIDFLALGLVVAISSLVLVLPVNRLMRWALAGESNRRSLVPAQSESRVW
jgi:hypothetical protein